ncbi:thymidine kinase, cytosolic-like isoform X2 [Ornithodoros turicata]
MFSGKTTELMRRMKRYQLANHNCVLVKYARDCRYDNENICTHDRQAMPAVKSTSLRDTAFNTDEVRVFGIDEGQFFPDVVEFAEEMAQLGKVVIIAALDGTYQRKGFTNILELVPLSESIIKLTAVCMICYSDAAYTKRLGYETEVEVIGGADKYMAVCRKCYFKKDTVGNSPDSSSTRPTAC